MNLNEKDGLVAQAGVRANGQGHKINKQILKKLHVPNLLIKEPSHTDSHKLISIVRRASA